VVLGGGSGQLLRPDDCALILVDYQNDWAKGYHESYAQVAENIRKRAVIENAVAMVASARELNVPIVHLQARRRFDYADIRDVITDAVLSGRSKPNREILIAREGTPGAEIVDELRPRPEDFLVTKPRRDAWYASSLESCLRSLRRETLLVGGVATNLAVEALVRGANDRDYNVVVLEDCCAGSPPEAHEWAVRHTFPVWARVMTSAQAIALLRASEPS
jgi:nicotinamidase-related amidase